MKIQARFKPRNGFALVVTVSMMVLLTIVVVATLSLSTITLRSVDRNAAQAVARANARLALVMAIGELQKNAGPDRRITMTADLEDKNSPNPQWTGVWNNEPGEETKPPKWLVSGDENIEPDKTLDEKTSVVLASSPSSDTTRKELRAEMVHVEGAKMDGKFAYWVGDEGVKARVDTARPTDKETEDFPEKRQEVQAQSPLEPGLSKIGGDNGAIWSKFDSNTDSIDKTTLASMGTVALAAQDSTGVKRNELEAYYRNDLTTGGYGLPVNVKDGGLKTDLSIIFDRSQESKGYAKEFFGASPSNISRNGYTIQDFTSITDNKKFFLSPSLSATKPTGPNWGILWNYARQWQLVNSNGESQVVDVNPLADTPTRNPDYPAYDQYGSGSNNQDRQHTSSSLVPILAKLQITFAIRAVAASEAGKGKIQLMMKPLISIWNPHNVALQGRRYEIDWGLYPYFRFGSGASPGNAGTGGLVWNMWMRDRWGMRDSVDAGSTSMTTKYMILKTPVIDFQPGEFRLLSVAGTPTLGTENDLKVGWNNDGYYVTDMFADTGQSTTVGSPGVGAVVQRPLNHYVWIGDFFLEDTQNGDTYARYGNRIKASDPGSWFTFKSYGTNPVQYMTRSPGLWTGGSKYKDAKIPVPEQIRSGWNGATTTKPAPTVSSLMNTKQDIGTWAFVIRQSAEMKEVGQGLRGWVDANPRALVTNPRWDGSNIDSNGKRTGWHFPAQYMGGAHNMPPSALVGDNLGGNRGLISEHGQPRPEPQTGLSIDRYQGLGGATDKTSGGQDHVILYDVPRAPLASIGQFQHAQLSRYNYEPGFVVGNSYANPRLKLEQTFVSGYGEGGRAKIADISYEVNEKLWDDFYFSTMGLDYLGSTGNSLKGSYPMETTKLSNPRMVFRPLSGDKDADAILSEAGMQAPRAISARVMVEGAFNVNSTSVTAWKAVLSSMAASKLPVINRESGKLPSSTSWEKNGGIRFSRFGYPAINNSYQKGDGVADQGFWLGWRELSSQELDDLAKAIVDEVQERGPFRSMADFVNRDLNGKNDEQKRKGALQAAIDKTINNSLPTGNGGVGETATKPIGDQYSNAIGAENQAAGNPGYLMQGDLLQSLAPILQVRSDYFRVRTYGDARDASGKIIAKAYCEAFVQRLPEYVDAVDKPEANERNGGTLSPMNKKFGRRFNVVSFRWLSPSEI